MPDIFILHFDKYEIVNKVFIPKYDAMLFFKSFKIYFKCILR